MHTPLKGKMKREKNVLRPENRTMNLSLRFPKLRTYLWGPNYLCKKCSGFIYNKIKGFFGCYCCFLKSKIKRKERKSYRSCKCLKLHSGLNVCINNMTKYLWI